MSHIPERKDKDCLNCGAIVRGRYCQVCGQENIVPHETFWHMVTHFFYDITHFDSKFFVTAKDLFFKPGFLTKEYTKGRRARYLHPIKMYVFTSAVFFLLFFSVFKPPTKFTEMNDSLTPVERQTYITGLENKIKEDPGNTGLNARLLRARDTTVPLTFRELRDSGDLEPFITFVNTKFRTFEEYDSAELALPPNERDGWFVRRLTMKQYQLNEEFSTDPEAAGEKFVNSLFHRLPYMLFISLPLFALILKLVYIRRKQFYYADHGVFTIHLYVFSFLILLLVFSLDKLNNIVHLDIIGWVMGGLFLVQFFYLYKAMRNFYGQRRAKTILKFLVVSVISILMMLVLFVLFAFFSAFTY